MADNVTFTNTGTGAVPNTTVVRTRQSTGGSHVQFIDVAPALASPVSGGQYALSVTTTTVKTLTVPATATHAWISCDPASPTVRWTRDGTSPTTSVGHALIGGDSIEMDNVTSLRFISTTGTATIQVSYHRYA